MFGVFEVWYFDVRSKTSSKPECAMWVCHESVSVGVANQGLGPIGAINGTMGGRWEQLEEDGGRQQKMEHPGVIGSQGENPGHLKRCYCSV